MSIHRTITTAGAGALVAAGLVFGAAVPANASDAAVPSTANATNAAATVNAPDSTATAQTAPGVDAVGGVPHVTGLRTVDGVVHVLGTAQPGAIVFVVADSAGAIGTADETGAFTVPLFRSPVPSFEVYARVDGTNTDRVQYRVVDGQAVPVTNPSEAGWAAPTDLRVERTGGRDVVTGTGVPGAYVTVKVTANGWSATTVADDGTFRVTAGVTPAARYELRQGNGSGWSQSVFVDAR